MKQSDWLLCLVVSFCFIQRITAEWHEIVDNTSNYDSHPYRGTVIFVKAILTSDCKGFAFFTVSEKEHFHSTPMINYTIINGYSELILSYDYSSAGFASSGVHKRADSIRMKIARLSNRFSFTLSFTKSKVFLIFNGRLLFIDTSQVMLLDDYDYASYLEPSKALAFVNDCPVSEQRVIIRKTCYVRTFNYASAHWITNQRALGPVSAGNTVTCTIKHFASPSGSFELGMYAERNYTRAGQGERAFGGLTLNYNFGGDLNAIYLTKLGRYSDENYEMIRDFGYDAQIDMDGNDYCVSIEFDTTLFYIVSGSKHVSTTSQRDESVVSKDDFYFSALRVGHGRRLYQEGITNRTWSRCALHGSSKYRTILDRSQRLTLTYSFYEDMELMRRYDRSSLMSLNGDQLSAD